MNPAREELIEALRGVIDPELRKDIVELQMLRDVEVDDAGHAQVRVALTTPGCPLKADIRDQVVRQVGALAGIQSVSVDFDFMNEAEREALRGRLREGRQYRKPGVSVPASCRVIAVTSGKGGVGKSTFTVNLATAMARAGHEVGVLDADVYGYSVPLALGVGQRPVSVDKMLVPPVAHDVRCISIGLFLDADSAVMWRGPMLHRALEQFLGDVHWGDLDYLFVDMPPGTGDVAISLGQMLPRAEVLVVTTPQPAAQQVAQRAAAVAKKMDQRVIGVVENMADPLDGPSVFGRGGGAALAEEIGAPLLATLDLDPAVREGGDAGVPAALGEGRAADAFRALAETIAASAPELPPPPPEARIKKSLSLL